jgi:hypothetical protein
VRRHSRSRLRLVRMRSYHAYVYQFRCRRGKTFALCKSPLLPLIMSAFLSLAFGQQWEYARTRKAFVAPTNFWSFVTPTETRLFTGSDDAELREKINRLWDLSAFRVDLDIELLLLNLVGREGWELIEVFHDQTSIPVTRYLLRRRLD